MALKSSIFLLLALYQLASIDQVISQRDLDDAVQTFARNLFRQIYAMNETNNFIVSPSAIQRQLLLVMQGAHGATYEEIKKIIEVDGIDESSYIDEFAKKPAEFSSNDFIFKSPKVKLRMPFKLLGKLLFDVTPDEVEFEDVNETASAISESIEMANNGLVRKFIKSRDLSAQTSICFMNSALFGGQFVSPFRKKDMLLEKFYDYGKSVVQTKLLYGLKSVGYAVVNELKATAMSLSYVDSDEKLLILLPTELTGLKAVFEKAMRIDFSLLIRKLKPTLVSIRLPQFVLDYRVKFQDVLPQLGAKLLFSPEADFENALESPVPNEPCMFSKAHFDINEQGSSTDQANIRLKTTELNEAGVPENFFFAQHPFIFFIHNNDTIHFFGRVVAMSVESADHSAELPLEPNTEGPDDD